MPSYTESFDNFSVTSFLENYGWILLGAFILLYCLYNKLSPKINKYLQQREDRNYAAKYHKDADIVFERLTQQQTLVEKLQEKYNKEAEEYKKKQEERERKKREEFLEKHDSRGGGQKLGSSSGSGTNKSFKPEYNPLMGSGGGTSYRPQRKKPCSGGGCGR